MSPIWNKFISAAPPLRVESDMLDQMNSALAEVKARQTLDRMNRLRGDVQTFAFHARTLNAVANNIDSRLLVQEADSLLLKLGAARSHFEHATFDVNSLSRGLSSRVPEKGGMPAAAQWGSQLRAGSKHFSDAARSAEKELQHLYRTGAIGMSSPNRTPTAPDSAFDVLLNFADALSRWIEHAKRNQHK